MKLPVKYVRASVFGAALIAAMSAVPAAAQAVVDFNTLPINNGGFTGPYNQNGFTVTAVSGAGYVNNDSNTGSTLLEGDSFRGGGTFLFTNGSAFSFGGIDYGVFAQSTAPILTLTVNGYLNGVLVGSDSFNATGSNTGGNLTLATFGASSLAGVRLDQIRVGLSGTNTPEQVYQGIDNVRFGAAVPEAATWAMMIVGMGAAGVMMRRRRMSGVRLAYAP